MERRNTERVTQPLVHEFMELCKMHDLQGLLMDGENNFTAAVEAFTIDAQEHPKSIRELTRFSDEHWYAVLALSDALNISFNIFIHRDGTKRIHQYIITKNVINGSLRPEHKDLSENDFIVWWAAHKQTIQTKGYRHDMVERIKDSYFDHLLESHGLKWGGNIDAFVSVLSDNHRPIAIIENRVSTRNSLYKYDPAHYYDDDRNTWLPLFLLCEYLSIQLFLCTYSTRTGETSLIGISEVDISQRDRLTYKNNARPCDNIFQNLSMAKEWLLSKLSD